MKQQKNGILFSMFSFLKIIAAVAIFSSGVTYKVVEIFITPNDKDKINELNQKISTLSNGKDSLENRISILNSQCDEKWNSVILSNKESFEKEKNTLIVNTKAESIEKKIESDKIYESKILSLNNDIKLLKEKIQIQHDNGVIVAELSKLSNQKEDLIKHFNKTDSALKDLNAALAAWDASCIEIDKIPSGMMIGNQKENFNACKMKKEYTLEHARFNNILNTTKMEIDSVNNQKTILYNRLKLP